MRGKIHVGEFLLLSLLGRHDTTSVQAGLTKQGKSADNAAVAGHHSKDSQGSCLEWELEPKEDMCVECMRNEPSQEVFPFS